MPEASDTLDTEDVRTLAKFAQTKLFLPENKSEDPQKMKEVVKNWRV